MKNHLTLDTIIGQIAIATREEVVDTLDLELICSVVQHLHDESIINIENGKIPKRDVLATVSWILRSCNTTTTNIDVYAINDRLLLFLDLDRRDIKHFKNQLTLIDLMVETKTEVKDTAIDQVFDDLVNGRLNHRKGKRYSTYIMKGSCGDFKIGKSADPIKRLKQLRTGDPKLSLIAVVDKDYEMFLHTKYKDHNTSGEWFCLSPDILDKLIQDHGFKTIPLGL